VRPPRRRGAVHDGLVGARALVGTRYLADPALRAEYARDIAPRTEAALARVLVEAYAPGAAAPGRAIDLGAGTGAAGRALRARFGAALEIVAADVVAAPGVLRVDLARELPPVDGRFDLVVAAHLLNELFVDRAPGERARLRAARVRAWADALLAPGGRIVLVEPALRETSRALLEVRDQLVAGGLAVLAPCFWRGPCPALVEARDWCHDAVPAAADAPRVDFSYLVLAARDDAAGVPAPDPALFRIVSDPLPDKGRLRIYGCGGPGRHLLVRLDRDASAANAGLDGVRRGDVLRVEGAVPRPDGLRLTAESSAAAASER
jgi:hypothetical protein